MPCASRHLRTGAGAPPAPDPAGLPGARAGSMRPMHMRFDHAVVVVESLPAAVAAFTDAGFTVSPGGRHDAIPTENALVAFADGTYLELLAFREPAVRTELRALRASDAWAAHLHGTGAVARRFLPRLAGPEGVADAVVARGALTRFAAESRKREFVMTGPVPMRRERNGDAALAWELLLPAEDAIPFMIEDRTPREWRVPSSPGATRHANAATGIAAVEVTAREPAAVALRLADLFGARLEARDGRTCVTFADTAWWLMPGERDGASGVRLRGTRPLPAAIAALGVRAAE